MIWFYTGPPGTGKSLSLMRDIKAKLRAGGNVICVNMKIKREGVIASLGKHAENIKNLHELTLDEFTPQWCMDFALDNHVPDVENQTIIIVDECQDIWSPETMKLKVQEGDRYYRVNWHDFMSKHRHFGYNVIMTSHMDKWIDAQFRILIQFEVQHRILSAMGVWGAIIGLVCGGRKVFMRVEKDYRSGFKLSDEKYVYSKKLGAMYYSHSRFHQELEKREKQRMVLAAKV